MIKSTEEYQDFAEKVKTFEESFDMKEVFNDPMNVNPSQLFSYKFKHFLIFDDAYITSPENLHCIIEKSSSEILLFLDEFKIEKKIEYDIGLSYPIFQISNQCPKENLINFFMEGTKNNFTDPLVHYYNNIYLINQKDNYSIFTSRIMEIAIVGFANRIDCKQFISNNNNIYYLSKAELVDMFSSSPNPDFLSNQLSRIIDCNAIS